MAWHRRWWAGVVLRGGGVVLLGVAVLAVRALSGAGEVAAQGGAGVRAFLLAALAFVCGTCGAALLVVGARLFDPVALGPRWQRFRR